jgi:hypothetical protein
MARKFPQSKINRALATLTQSDIEEFELLIKNNNTYTDISKWFASKGFDNITPQNCSDYYRQYVPKGEQAILINKITKEFIGVEPDQLTEFSAAIAAKTLSLLTEDLKGIIGKASPQAKLEAMVSLLKETRTAGNDKLNRELLEEREELIMTGVFMVFEKLEKIYKDTPFSLSISAAKEAIMTEISSTL